MRDKTLETAWEETRKDEGGSKGHFDVALVLSLERPGQYATTFKHKLRVNTEGMKGGTVTLMLLPYCRSRDLTWAVAALAAAALGVVVSTLPSS